MTSKTLSIIYTSTLFAVFTLAAIGTQVEPSKEIQPPVPSITVGGRIVRVIDGDTVEIAIEYRAHIRVIDCWAPEKNTPEGVKAMKFLQSQATIGRPCLVNIPLKRDIGKSITLGRLLGDIWLLDEKLVPSQPISKLMRDAGYATLQKEEPIKP